MTEDEQVFGKDAWVYCKDHVNAHMTGWCGVPVSRKLGLGITGQQNAALAIEKCALFGLNALIRIPTKTAT